MNRDMIFKSQQHITFFEENTKNEMVNSREFSLIYLLGLTEITRVHFDEIYSKDEGIKPESILADWQTKESTHVTILAFNLYEDYLFGFSDQLQQNERGSGCEEEQKGTWDMFIKTNSIRNLFSNITLREFYIQAISLRLD